MLSAADKSRAGRNAENARGKFWSPLTNVTRAASTLHTHSRVALASQRLSVRPHSIRRRRPTTDSAILPRKNLYVKISKVGNCFGKCYKNFVFYSPYFIFKQNILFVFHLLFGFRFLYIFSFCEKSESTNFWITLKIKIILFLFKLILSVTVFYA